MWHYQNYRHVFINGGVRYNVDQDRKLTTDFFSLWDNEQSMMIAITITMIIMKLLILSILRSVCWSEVNKWSLQVEFKYLILVVWWTSLRTVVFVERRCDLNWSFRFDAVGFDLNFVSKIRTKLVDIIASCAWLFNLMWIWLLLVFLF